jgi:hypothetical protein
MRRKFREKPVPFTGRGPDDINYFHSDLKALKKQVITAAKDLGYGDEVIDRIKAATDEAEIQRIMIDARKAMFE